MAYCCIPVSLCSACLTQSTSFTVRTSPHTCSRLTNDLCHRTRGLSKLLQNDVWILALKNRFEPFEYQYLHIMSITGGQTNTTRHTTTCVGIFGTQYCCSNSWQNSLKPMPSTILISLMSLHVNEASFLQVAVELELQTSSHAHLDAPFQDVPSCC